MVGGRRPRTVTSSAAGGGAPEARTGGGDRCARAAALGGGGAGGTGGRGSATGGGGLEVEQELDATRDGCPVARCRPEPPVHRRVQRRAIERRRHPAPELDRADLPRRSDRHGDRDVAGRPAPERLGRVRRPAFLDHRRRLDARPGGQWRCLRTHRRPGRHEADADQERPTNAERTRANVTNQRILLRDARRAATREALRSGLITRRAPGRDARTRGTRGRVGTGAARVTGSGSGRRRRRLGRAREDEQPPGLLDRRPRHAHRDGRRRVPSDDPDDRRPCAVANGERRGAVLVTLGSLSFVRPDAVRLLGTTRPAVPIDRDVRQLAVLGAAEVAHRRLVRDRAEAAPPARSPSPRR